jgi:hypothetical protein
LTRPRITAFVALAAALAVYFTVHERLPEVSKWWDVAILVTLVLPAVFLTVLLLLPLRKMPWRWIAALVSIALAVAFSIPQWQGPASFAKLAAAMFVGWLFLDFFEEASWVVIVALVIPWVDGYSVWKGPTHTIVKHHVSAFNYLSFGFPVPGEDNTANLGIPDLLFFALFLAAAAQYGLRTRLTWLLMTASFGATIVLVTAWSRVPGLPALPLLSFAFLVANGDLLWRKLKEDYARRDAASKKAPKDKPSDAAP